MQVIRAEAMGMCFGVQDALESVGKISHPETVTIYGELVHNETVLVQLKQRGFPQSQEEDRTLLPPTTNVLITAHGISNAKRYWLEAAGKRLIDTVCPLVRRVHRAAQMLQAEGRHVVVLGRHRHVEVLGIIEDLTSFDVVQTLQEVRRFPYSRLGIICQSTTPPHVAEQLYAALQRSNPHANIRFIDTICQPTRDRQVAVDRLLQQVDTMVVVGGRKSNNTLQLVERCRMQGVPTWHVQGVADLDPHWFTHCHIVGLTAGTSTLDATIDEVFEALCRLGIDATAPAQSA